MFSGWSRMTWQTSWHMKHSMHFLNSWLRSTSAWYMRRVPSGSFARGLKAGMVLAFS